MLCRLLCRKRIKPSQLSVKLYACEPVKDWYYPRVHMSSNCVPLLWYLNSLDVDKCRMIQCKSLPRIELNYDIPVTHIKVIKPNDRGEYIYNTSMTECNIYDGDVIINIIFQTDTNFESPFDKQCSIVASFKSYRKSSAELAKYIKNIEDAYYKSETSNNYHIYVHNGNMEFSKFEIDRSQTFDNPFFDQKKLLMQKIDLLNNKEHFYDRGLKRKLSYLLVGEPGSGKTSIVSAAANYAKRNIISISLDNVKDIRELTSIIYLNTYNGQTIKNDKLIIFLDEIDKATMFDDSFSAMMLFDKKIKHVRLIVVNSYLC